MKRSGHAFMMIDLVIAIAILFILVILVMGLSSGMTDERFRGLPPHQQKIWIGENIGLQFEKAESGSLLKMPYGTVYVFVEARPSGVLVRTCTTTPPDGYSCEKILPISDFFLRDATIIAKDDPSFLDLLKAVGMTPIRKD